MNCSPQHTLLLLPEAKPARNWSVLKLTAAVAQWWFNNSSTVWSPRRGCYGNPREPALLQGLQPFIKPQLDTGLQADSSFLPLLRELGERGRDLILQTALEESRCQLTNVCYHRQRLFPTPLSRTSINGFIRLVTNKEEATLFAIKLWRSVVGEK